MSEGKGSSPLSGGKDIWQPGEVVSAEQLDSVRYDSRTGLVPVVTQDAGTGQVLMQAYVNREALKRTLDTGQAWYWSRSRQNYWHKGDTSGNVQEIVEVRVDCDADAVLYLVHPAGPACHTGEQSCFYRRLLRKLDAVGVETPPAVATHAGNGDAHTPVSSDGTKRIDMDTSILTDLWTTLDERWRHRPQGSYTTYLFEQGVDKVGKKVGEEAVEVVIAAKNAVRHSGDVAERGSAGATRDVPAEDVAARDELAAESADLLYHLMALWRSAGLHPNEVFAVLRDRHAH